MPAPMFIPPWLNPPDPVATYQRGVQIGAQIGAQRAQQALRQQQLEQEANAQAVRAARDQQEMEMTNAYREARLGLEASETARRVQGQMKYQSLVQGGMDPMQAMMQTPEVWGSSLTGVASAMKESERLKRLENWKPSETTTPEGTRMAEVSPGRWQVIKAPLSAELNEMEVRDIPGTKKKAVYFPGQGLHVVDSDEAKNDAAEVGILKAQLLSVSRQLRQDPTNMDLQSEYNDVVDQLQDYGIKVPKMKSATGVAAVPAGTAATLPKVRSIKRIQ